MKHLQNGECTRYIIGRETHLARQECEAVEGEGIEVKLVSGYTMDRCWVKVFEPYSLG